MSAAVTERYCTCSHTPEVAAVAEAQLLGLGQRRRRTRRKPARLGTSPTPEVQAISWTPRQGLAGMCNGYRAFQNDLIQNDLSV